MNIKHQHDNATSKFTVFTYLKYATSLITKFTAFTYHKYATSFITLRKIGFVSYVLVSYTMDLLFLKNLCGYIDFAGPETTGFSMARLMNQQLL